MSFVLGAEGGLICDSWPGGLGRKPGAHDLDEQDMADWQFVPLTFEAVCDWAVVGSKRAPDSVDRARNKVLLYRNIGQTVGGMRRGVTLRLQGYIKSCNLQPLGDWDSHPSSALSACQHIWLGSGGHALQWDQTISAIRHIKQLVHNSIEGASAAPVIQRTGDLYLQRRVFTKVTASNAHHPNLLHTDDDGDGTAANIGDAWRVMAVLEMGHVDDTGEMAACSHLLIRQGSFVDVAVSIDIVVHTAKKTRHGKPVTTTRVYLNLLHVLVLAGPEAQTEATPATDHEDNIQYSGLSFGSSEPQ